MYILLFLMVLLFGLVLLSGERIRSKSQVLALLATSGFVVGCLKLIAYALTFTDVAMIIFYIHILVEDYELLILGLIFGSFLLVSRMFFNWIKLKLDSSQSKVNN